MNNPKAGVVLAVVILLISFGNDAESKAVESFRGEETFPSDPAGDQQREADAKKRADVFLSIVSNLHPASISDFFPANRDPPSKIQGTHREICRGPPTKDYDYAYSPFCRNKIHNFYYDVESKKCKHFIYGGCGGTKNNFWTLKECQKKCLTKIDVCEEPRKSGPCKGRHIRYFFNDKSRKCERFTYGGCEGNANRFMTKKACRKRCPNVLQKLEKIVEEDAKEEVEKEVEEKEKEDVEKEVEKEVEDEVKEEVEKEVGEEEAKVKKVVKEGVEEVVKEQKEKAAPTTLSAAAPTAPNVLQKLVEEVEKNAEEEEEEEEKKDVEKEVEKEVKEEVEEKAEEKLEDKVEKVKEGVKEVVKEEEEKAAPTTLSNESPSVPPTGAAPTAPPTGAAPTAAVA